MCNINEKQRTITIKNLRKRVSNYSLCLKILTNLIGFEEINNNEKISLADEVEIDTLITFKDCFMKFKNDRNNNEVSLSALNKIKMVENDTADNIETFWKCDECTYHNSINSTTCEICGLPNYVCVMCVCSKLSHHNPKPSKLQNRTKFQNRCCVCIVANGCLLNLPMLFVEFTRKYCLCCLC